MSEFGEFAKGCRDTHDVLQEILEAADRRDKRFGCRECHILYRQRNSDALDTRRFCLKDCEDAARH